MKKKSMLVLATLGVGAVVLSATGLVFAAPNPAQPAQQEQQEQQEQQDQQDQAAMQIRNDQQDCNVSIDSQRRAEALRSQIDAIKVRTLDTVQAQVASAMAEKQAAYATMANSRDEMLRAELTAQDAQARAGRGQQDAAPKIWSDEFEQGEDSGWLGVETEGISADRAKELKLSEIRGVYLSEVEEDSPAAKAGLKSGDVVTEFNGEHVEGTVQFRRLIREIPSGHKVQITILRDGHSQTVSVTLGSVEESMDRGFGEGFGSAHGDRMFRMLPMPAIAPMPPMPPMQPMSPTPRAYSFVMPDVEIYSAASTPTIGVSAEDLSGQLGAYFGAPDSEGVLITEVQSGSPAEKSGIKAGDVVVKIAGERVRNLGEMRDRLRDKRGDKSVAITVLRKGSEQNINVEPTKPQSRIRSNRRATL